MNTSTNPAQEDFRPFDHDVDGKPRHVGVEDKQNPRFYFYHPFLKTLAGGAVKVSKYTRREIIAELENAWRSRTVTLGLVEYGELAAAPASLKRIQETLLDTTLPPETMLAELRQQLRDPPPVAMLPAPGTSKPQEQPGAANGADPQPTNGGPPSPSRPVEEKQPAVPPTKGTPALALTREDPESLDSKEAAAPLNYRELAELVLREHGPLGAAEIWEKGSEKGLTDRAATASSDPVASLRPILRKAARNPASMIELRNGKFQLRPDAASAPNASPMAVKFVRKEPIPPPPRRPDGTINWKEVPTELLAKLVADGPKAQIAQAWEVSMTVFRKHCSRRGIHGRRDWNTVAAQQARGKAAALLQPARPAQPVVTKPKTWERKAKFLHTLWEMGGPKIAEQNDCNLSTVYHHADALKLPRPKHGYFLQKDRKIPAEVRALMEQLDAEEAKAKQSNLDFGP
jgi:hypothetical protein